MRALLAPTLVLALAACGPNRTIPERGAYAPASPAPLECLPNLDGRVELAELPTAFGVPVSFLANPEGVNRPVDVAGSVGAAGKRTWALATDYADDQVAKVTVQRLQGQWYAGSFPGGQFVGPLDLGGRIEGVYAKTSDEVRLLGYASAAADPAEGRTLVVYTQPAVAFRLPLEDGKSWVSVSDTVNATVRGLPYAGRDTYQTRVDGAGELQLPDVTFTQAFRVRTTLTLQPAVGQSVTRRQVSWVFECFGEVARATAREGETQDDFTTAAELRRFGL